MPIDEPVLVDTSAIIASFHAASPEHERCVTVVAALPLAKSFTCWPVVTEAVYMLRKLRGDADNFLDSLSDHELELLELSHEDLPGVRRIIDAYRYDEIDLADAALVHLAEREDIGTIFTLDRRHFRLLSRASGRHFRLLPDDFDG